MPQLKLIQSNTLRPLSSTDKSLLRVVERVPTKALPLKPKRFPVSPCNPNSPPPYGFSIMKGALPRCKYGTLPPKPLCKRPAR